VTDNEHKAVHYSNHQFTSYPMKGGRNSKPKGPFDAEELTRRLESHLSEQKLQSERQRARERALKQHHNAVSLYTVELAKDCAVGADFDRTRTSLRQRIGETQPQERRSETMDRREVENDDAAERPLATVETAIEASSNALMSSASSNHVSGTKSPPSGTFCVENAAGAIGPSDTTDPALFPRLPVGIDQDWAHAINLQELHRSVKHRLGPLLRKPRTMRATNGATVSVDDKYMVDPALPAANQEKRHKKRILVDFFRRGSRQIA
jgi:hypothetical protein